MTCYYIFCRYNYSNNINLLYNDISKKFNLKKNLSILKNEFIIIVRVDIL